MAGTKDGILHRIENIRRSHSSNQSKYQLTVKTIIFQQTDIRNLQMKPD